MRSGSRHRGEAGGGWLFGFPPLLATDGRIHKGDCDMRNGAIFARGSCRALKWMALFGVVFALGAGQAFAQPTVSSGSFDPNATTITLTASELVYGSPPASAFTVMVTPLGGAAAANVVTAVTPISQLSPSTTIMLTVTTAIQTGSTVAVTYAPAAPATTGATTNQIRNIGGTALAAITTSPTISENDQVPSIAEVEDMNLVLGDRITAIELPEATRGNQPFTYTLNLDSAISTPAGVTINTGAIGPTGTAGGDTDPGFRFLASPPTLLGNASVAGVYTLTYSVADSTTQTAQTIPQTFMITVSAAAPTITGAMGEIVKTALVGNSLTTKTIGGTKRNHVPEGARDLQVEVTVEWTVEELRAIYGSSDTADPAEVIVMIMTDPGSTGEDWISWIDDRQDVNFPDNRGQLEDTVEIKLPKKPQSTERASDTYEATGKLDVDILHDDREAENDMFYIKAVTSSDINVAAGRSGDKRTLDTVIEDDDPQSVTVKKGTSSGPSKVYESDEEIEFTVAADPPRNQLPLEVDLDMLDLEGTTVRAAKISVDTRRLELNADGDGSGNSATVTVHLPASDGDRMDDEYQLQATVNPYSLASGTDTTVNPTSHKITVLDVHKLPTLMVSPATATLQEGTDEKTELTLTINRNPANTTVSSTEKLQYTQEEVTVMLSMGAGSTASASDYSIMPASVTFPKRERGSYTASMTVEVEALPDEDLDDMEMLVLDAEVAGGVAANGTDKDMHMGVSTLTIEEGTMKYVYPETDEAIQAVIYAAKEAGMGADMMFNPGEMIEIESADALFKHAEGVTLSYSAMSDNDDVATVAVSGAMVTVTAGDMPGVMAHITITAHASPPAGAKGLPQTDPREASVIFPVEVGLAALSIELSQSDDMHLAEGGMGGMVTATANRMVTANTKVTLMRDRSKSSADDMDFEADPITILAGQMSGSTMVMAVEDDMMEDMEELVLYGMTEGMEGEVTGEVMFYIWDAAVPALPIIAQLLLAAFLAFGGYRRYRRR